MQSHQDNYQEQDERKKEAVLSLERVGENRVSKGEINFPSDLSDWMGGRVDP